MNTTRERILHHGLDLMSKSGTAGVTLGLLAEQTGISKSGLFAHFGSKDEVQISLLERAAQVAQQHVVMPAMRVAEGLPRLDALVHNWLGWSTKAGLAGGCPVAAAMFELDDTEGPVRDRVLAMETEWRGLLAQLVRQAIEQGHLRDDLEVDQFVFELCGIYLSHHAALRFVRDRRANARAHAALWSLIDRARPARRKAQAPRRAKTKKTS
jgi:AcrR family transcriptional regulator